MSFCIDWNGGDRLIEEVMVTNFGDLFESYEDIFDTTSSIVKDPARKITRGVQYRMVQFNENQGTGRRRRLLGKDEGNAAFLQFFIYPKNNRVSQILEPMIEDPLFASLFTQQIQMSRYVDTSSDSRHALKPWSDGVVKKMDLAVSDVPPATGLYVHKAKGNSNRLSMIRCMRTTIRYFSYISDPENRYKHFLRF